MTTDRGQTPQRLLPAIAVVWTGGALLWALQIVLPTPSFAFWSFTVLAKESGPLLAGFAFLGVVLALVSRLYGARSTAMASAAIGAAAVFLSLAQTAQVWNTARAGNASPSEQFSGPTVEGLSEMVTYARPGGERLKLDVWRPSGDEAEDIRGRPAVVLVHGGGWRAGPAATRRSGTPGSWRGDTWSSTWTIGWPRRPGGGTPPAT